MPRASSPTIDPALDAAALLRRMGFFGLFVILPVLAQVARRAAVILAPIAVVLLVIASAIDRRQRPVRPGIARLLTAPAFLAGMLVVLWSALSLAWTPFPGPALERLANLLATIGLALLGYLALPDRMRSANLYLLPLGVIAGAIVAIVLGVFGAHITPAGTEEDGALDRGLILLILLIWPALAWLRSRRRDREALGLALLVAAALTVQPNATQIAALAIGAVAFAVTSFRPKLGVALTALISAALLAVAPLLPFLARPIGAALFGPLAPGVLSLKSWQKVVTTEPVRLITGHGFETALRGRLVGLVPINAPTTALFEFWYELGIVGAFAAAFALHAAIRRAGRDVPALVPAAMACFASAFAVACLGVGLTAIWWLTALAIAVVVFIAVERGQFRTSRPKVARLRRLPEGGA
ncbi:peptide ABC transporter permease [Methylobacterium sp. NEAU 140]|uniref:peptide ABC transporter permease n=1 Tax=Methylobacterium sp. NEAU 140 TaxID=3064945 RepID=UPI002734CA35|nr:peptide ABC transporter permease [Methylobacterium sp. NEAU 140]MDP4023054.1 peptide ABC transporter permease [Methylobacterium sp. NEAU 140]